MVRTAVAVADVEADRVAEPNEILPDVTVTVPVGEAAPPAARTVIES